MKIWSPSTFDPSNVSKEVANIYKAVTPYLYGFLCADHPYRDGKMCPFMAGVIDEDRVFFTAVSTNDLLRKSECSHSIIDTFQMLCSPEKGYATLILLPPKLLALEDFLNFHAEVRMNFVRNGLLIGALYPTNPASSLHRRDFYPLRPPEQIYAIRNIVPNDILIFKFSAKSLDDRIESLKIYTKMFSDRSGREMEGFLRRARRLRRWYGFRQTIKPYHLHIAAIGIVLALLAVILLI